MASKSTTTTRRLCHIFLTGQPSVGKTTIIKAVIGACTADKTSSDGDDARHNDGDVLQCKQHAKLAGLYTEESRGSDGKRDGFDLICFIERKDEDDCNNNTVHVSRTNLSRAQAKTCKGKPFVGKYLVDVGNVDKFGTASLQQVANTLQANDTSKESSEEASPIKTVCILDEVGKMEMLCPTFLPAVHNVMDAISEYNHEESTNKSNKCVLLGTIPTPRYGHVIQAVEDIRSREDVLVLYVTKSNRDELREKLVTMMSSWMASSDEADDFDIQTDFGEYVYQRPIGSGSMTNTSSKNEAAKVDETKKATINEPNLVPCDPLVHATMKPRVLILGHTASPKPSNPLLAYSERSMWKILSCINDLPHKTIKDAETATKEQIDSYQLNVKKTLHDGICIWDVLANVHVKGKGQRGSKRKKSTMSNPNDVPSFISKHKLIHTIGFIGTKAHGEYLKQFGKESLNGFETVILPSSSPANTRLSLNEKLEQWKKALY